MDEIVAHFPYTPYPQQVELMRVLRDALIEGKGNVSVIESPTGTGKTQCLLNPALAWLAEGRESTLTHSTTTTAATSALSRSQQLRAIAERRIREASSSPTFLQTKRHRRRHDDSSSSDESDHKDIEQTTCTAADDDYAGLWPSPRRVLYLTRTHSQLSQVSAEMERTWWFTEEARAQGVSAPSFVQLAGRAQLCLNERIKTLANGRPEKLNELCKNARKRKAVRPGQRERQPRRSVRSDEESSGITVADIEDAPSETCASCEFADLERVANVADHLIYESRSIGAVLDVARRYRGCAFYASRIAAKFADVVFVPYIFLVDPALRKQSLAPALCPEQFPLRTAAALDLANTVCIFDEGHNVANAVTSSISSTCRISDLVAMRATVTAYLETYQSRLITANKDELRSISRACEMIERYVAGVSAPSSTLQPGGGSSAAGSTVMLTNMRVTPFIYEAQVDTIDFFRICRFFDDNHALPKLVGFSAAKGTAVGPTSLHAVQRLFACLAAAEEETSMVAILQDSAGERSFSVFALSPGAALGGVATGAHCTVLAGGTMEPFDILVKELFPGHQWRTSDPTDERPFIRTHAFGHVVPSSNFVVNCVGVGPAGREIKLVHSRKSEHEEMFREVGKCLVKMSEVIPGGIVVFFTSFEAESNFAQAAAAELAEIRRIKPTFRESATVDTTQLLEQYASQIRKPGSRGAMLTAVLGGKLSEGINFADDLGRCVAVVGLPYPNPSDPQVLLTLEYLGGSDARRYYDALCMRSVNQGIGRCLRHARDYAAIVLFDSRYNSAAVKNLLPRWLTPNVRKCEPDVDVWVRAIADFFRGKVCE